MVLKEADASTLSRAVQHYAKQLSDAPLAYGHGTSNALDEAAWLVLWALGLPLDTDIGDATAQATRLNAPQKQALSSIFEKRIVQRIPAAYLTQEAWLQGIPFYCDPRAIVPRSFIAELLAIGTIDPWLSSYTQRVLDLCTGNGSLAILAAMTYPDTTVLGTDLSATALEVAHINVARHALGKRISLVQCDGVAGLAGPFDLVLCNPPYVNSKSMAALPPEYRAEPSLALDGGSDGMDFIRRLLAELPPLLSPNAVLVLEIGNERQNFENAFPTLPVDWLPTSAGDDQVLLIQASDLASETT
jgi:ribosomal protein L3 glutamine methyltransferase